MRCECVSDGGVTFLKSATVQKCKSATEEMHRELFMGIRAKTIISHLRQSLKTLTGFYSQFLSAQEAEN